MIIWAGFAIAALTLVVVGFLIWQGKLQLRNPIRAFAVLVVTVIATYLMWFGYVLTQTLRSPQWCATALNAEKTAPGQSLQGLVACIDLLKIQLNSLALNSHINLGGLVACLVVLIVIVIAGAKLDAAIAGKFNLHLSREAEAEKLKAAAAAGAEQAAGAAKNEAEDIASGVAPVAQPAAPAVPSAKPETKFTAPPGEEL